MERDTGFENAAKASNDGHSQTSEDERGAEPLGSPRYPVDANAIGPAIGPIDPLDAALARALSAAVDAGRLDLVATLTEELRARRLATAGNVVELAPRKSSR